MTEDTIETLRARLAEAKRERDEALELADEALELADGIAEDSCRNYKSACELNHTLAVALAENEKLREALTELLAAVDQLFPNDGPLKIQAREALAATTHVETIPIRDLAFDVAIRVAKSSGHHAHWLSAVDYRSDPLDQVLVNRVIETIVGSLQWAQTHPEVDAIRARALSPSAPLEINNPGDPVNSMPAPAQGDKP